MRPLLLAAAPLAKLRALAIHVPHAGFPLGRLATICTRPALELFVGCYWRVTILHGTYSYADR